MWVQMKQGSTSYKVRIYCFSSSITYRTGSVEHVSHIPRALHYNWEIWMNIHETQRIISTLHEHYLASNIWWHCSIAQQNDFTIESKTEDATKMAVVGIHFGPNSLLKGFSFPWMYKISINPISIDKTNNNYDCYSYVNVLCFMISLNWTKNKLLVPVAANVN
jgi:hypothetical protein